MAITLRSVKEIIGNLLSKEAQFDEEDIGKIEKTNYEEAKNKQLTQSFLDNFDR